jgi:beta-xylosidase
MRAHRPWVLLAAVLVLSGCARSGGDAGSGPSSGAVLQSSSPSGPAVTGVPAGQFSNPVLGDDFPDPAVLQVGDRYYAYATQGSGGNIQTATSNDLVHWTAGKDALPTVGSWASSGNTWAPEVIVVGSAYVMFYVAHDNASGRQCIGRAHAGSPAGPFVDGRTKPLVCQTDLGGSIDPDPVRDPDGTIYLYWKNDGNCCGQPVRLWAQPLNADASALQGTATELFGNTKPWQGTLIEAPEMLVRRGRHYLFYSANDYASAHYAIGYATCRGPLGPCTDASEEPLVATDDAAVGPGHCYPVTLADGSTWLLYHAWKPGAVGTSYPGRELWLDRLRWDGDVPQPIMPDPGPQPDPPA